MKEKYVLPLVLLSVATTALFVGVLFKVNDKQWFIIIVLSVIAIVFAYVLMPRKCGKCGKAMKRGVNYRDNITYTCGKCGDVIDTKFGNGGSAS